MWCRDSPSRTPTPPAPPFPYVLGQRLQLKRHVPPPPLEHPYATCRPEVPVELLDEEANRLHVCLQFPPLENTTVQYSRPEEISFDITDEIHSGDGIGAQLMIGVAHFGSGSRQVVAKIYDPLYYYFDDADYTYEADKHYSREAATYMELDEPLGGKEVPKFYGSWTFVTRVVKRSVRLILMEYFVSPTLQDLDPARYTSEQRLDIIASVLEARVELIKYGIWHMDCHPRNILFRSDSDGQLSAVIIDFGLSVINRLKDGSYARPSDDEKPPNPLNYFFNCLGEYETSGWLTDDRQWMLDRWTNNDEFQLDPDWRNMSWSERLRYSNESRPGARQR
jgi:hypothetical protein